ncbi:MAG: hypothetical protein BIFFINMI_02606 [Phycisphaerae bacterium]|nr:hypothetical protein [Phycisphaerae bacterium]
MPRTVDLGFFRRCGACSEGVIGRLSALFDRHRGGVVTIRAAGVSASPVTVAARVRVRAAGRDLLLRQEDDPDPRLIVCEQGPERLWMRVMWSLVGPDGAYHGDGLSETILYADGEVRLAFGLRLVGTAHDAVTDAWVETGLGGAATGGQVGLRTPAALDAGKARSYAFKRQLKHRYVVVAGAKGGVAFGFYSLDGAPTDQLGTGKGIYWSAAGDRAPWYDTWGHLYGQWNGHSGWGAFDSGRIVVTPGEPGSLKQPGRGVTLQWKWLHEANEPTGEVFGLRAMLGLFFGKSADAAVARVKAFQNPVLPTRCENAEFRCYDVVEGTLLFRTAGMARMVFSKARGGRRVRLRLFGMPGPDTLGCEIDGQPVIAQHLQLGGQTDDPYGPNLARPGDRFMPQIGQVARPVSETVLTAALSRSAATTVDLGWLGPAVLAYVKWDDREVYGVHPRRLDGGPAMLFSPRTLCLHDVRAGEECWPRVNDAEPTRRRSAEPALVRVPLYWYPTNVATRGQCSTEVRRLRLSEDDDGQLILAVESQTPDGRLRSDVRARLACNLTHVCVEVASRLAVRRDCGLGEMQFLNSFPYNSWRSADWESDWVYTLDADGSETTCFVREPRGRSVVGDQKQHWRRAFFFAQGARERGNVFLLARMPKGAAGARQVGRYVLCRCWLDSHFSLDKLKLTKGAKFAVDYTLAVAGDRRLSRSEAAEIGRRSLASGKLEV